MFWGLDMLKLLFLQLLIQHVHVLFSQIMELYIYLLTYNKEGNLNGNN